jgi:hypothetical protein
VVWSDFNSDPGHVSSVRISPGNKVSPVQTITVPTAPQQPVQGTQVAVDRAGTATLVWYRDLAASANAVVEAVQLPAQGPARAVLTLASHYGNLSPSVVALRDGRTLVSWGAAYYGSPQFTTLSPAGTQETVQDLDTSPGGDTLFATAVNGHTAIAWVRNSDRTLHGRRISSEGDLGPDVQLSATGEDLGEYRLALTNSGVITAVWTNYADLRIAYVLAKGTSVAPQTVSTAPNGYCLSLRQCNPDLALSVDAADNAQAVWIGADGRVRARRVPFRRQAEGTRVLSPPSDFTNWPESVTAPSGIGMTMWTDSSSGTPQLYVAPASSGSVDPIEPPESTCPAIQLIGVAGLGANGHGPTLGAPVDTLAADLSQRVIRATGATGWASPEPLDYPAAGLLDLVGPDGHPTLAYGPSVASGVTELVRVVKTEVASRCGATTRLVIAGPSEGADVIGDSLASGQLTGLYPHVAGVVLFGDPRFNGLGDPLPVQYPNTGTGLFGSRPSRGVAGMADRVLSMCRIKDIVCQGPSGLLDAHLHYPEFESHWAAIVLGNRLYGASKTKALALDRARLNNNAVEVACVTSVPAPCLARVDAAVLGDFGFEIKTFWVPLFASTKTAGGWTSSWQPLPGLSVPSGKRIELDMTVFTVSPGLQQGTSQLSFQLRHK